MGNAKCISSKHKTVSFLWPREGLKLVLQASGWDQRVVLAGALGCLLQRHLEVWLHVASHALTLSWPDVLNALGALVLLRFARINRRPYSAYKG